MSLSICTSTSFEGGTNLPDNSKAVLNFASGAAQIEGQEQFVAECVTKFGKSSDGAPVLLDQSVGHAWDWLALHANQRMQAVNFFLLASAFLTAAYVAAVKESTPIVAIGVACLGVLFCVVFYAFEVRIRELIKTGETALGHAQEKLAAATGLTDFEICKRVEKPRYRWTSYHRVILSLYSVTGFTFVVGALYALHLSGHFLTTSGFDYRSIFHGLHRLVLAAGGALVLFWAQRLVRDQRSPRWLSLVAVLALLVTGMFVLVVVTLKAIK